MHDLIACLAACRCCCACWPCRPWGTAQLQGGSWVHRAGLPQDCSPTPRPTRSCGAAGGPHELGWGPHGQRQLQQHLCGQCGGRGLRRHGRVGRPGVLRGGSHHEAVPGHHARRLCDRPARGVHPPLAAVTVCVAAERPSSVLRACASFARAQCCVPVPTAFLQLLATELALPERCQPPYRAACRQQTWPPASPSRTPTPSAARLPQERPGRSTSTARRRPGRPWPMPSCSPRQASSWLPATGLSATRPRQHSRHCALPRWRPHPAADVSASKARAPLSRRCLRTPGARQMRSSAAAAWCTARTTASGRARRCCAWTWALRGAGGRAACRCTCCYPPSRRSGGCPCRPARMLDGCGSCMRLPGTQPGLAVPSSNLPGEAWQQPRMCRQSAAALKNGHRLQGCRAAALFAKGTSGTAPPSPLCLLCQGRQRLRRHHSEQHYSDVHGGCKVVELAITICKGADASDAHPGPFLDSDGQLYNLAATVRV